jgi:hypothetical protein
VPADPMNRRASWHGNCTCGWTAIETRYHRSRAQGDAEIHVATMPPGA